MRICIVRCTITIIICTIWLVTSWKQVFVTNIIKNATAFMVSWSNTIWNDVDFFTMLMRMWPRSYWTCWFLVFQNQSFRLLLPTRVFYTSRSVWSANMSDHEWKLTNLLENRSRRKMRLRYRSLRACYFYTRAEWKYKNLYYWGI